jgi:hypothetical protein
LEVGRGADQRGVTVPVVAILVLGCLLDLLDAFDY